MLRHLRLGSSSSAIAAVAVVILLVAVTTSMAMPRTRTIKTSSRRNLGSLSNSLLSSSSSSSSSSCHQNVPCGWALYHQTWRSALRPIFQYTRNTLCDCASGTQCVYQENRSEMRAYVFYCRRNDGSRDLYQFPNNT